MYCIEPLAPIGTEVADYDRRHLALYAALLEADDAGRPWEHAALSLMHLDAADSNAEACWRSHLERAHWIVGEGLESALVGFNARRSPVTAD
jgi:hypothetical protein